MPKFIIRLPPLLWFISINHRPTIRIMGSRVLSNVAHQGVWGGSSALISTSRERSVAIRVGSLGATVVKVLPSFNSPVIEFSLIVTDRTSSCCTCLIKDVYDISVLFVLPAE